MARLTDIAFDMKHQALRGGEAHRELMGGLRLDLSCIAGEYTLKLSRPAVMPSDQEISIARAAFNVPMQAERRDLDHSATLRWPAARGTS